MGENDESKPRGPRTSCAAPYPSPVTDRACVLMVHHEGRHKAYLGQGIGWKTWDTAPYPHPDTGRTINLELDQPGPQPSLHWGSDEGGNEKRQLNRPDTLAPVYHYPLSVPGHVIERFLTEVGLDPIDLESLAEVRISPWGLRVTRQRHDELGGKPRALLDSSGNPDRGVAVQVTDIRIEWGK